MPFFPRFGDGYTVIIRVSDDMSKITALKEFIASKFIGVQLKEEHRNVLHYHLPSASSSLARVFHYLEMTRDDYSVEDYSVSQTTLDQVGHGPDSGLYFDPRFKLDIVFDYFF
jgi:ATP-binding cassette, subfamily A (ABC1), member 3